MDGTARGKTVGKGESRLDLRLFGPCSDVSVVKGRTLTGLTSTPCYPDGTLRCIAIEGQYYVPPALLTKMMWPAMAICELCCFHSAMFFFFVIDVKYTFVLFVAHVRYML